ncbi:hypothetical protein FRC19_007689 [Serendipita sp. 401]|nr:hypothetical protein FRC19_007689 [Serendipita sp. 401]
MVINMMIVLINTLKRVWKIFKEALRWRLWAMMLGDVFAELNEGSPEKILLAPVEDCTGTQSPCLQT